MKTIIAGSRDANSDHTIRGLQFCPWNITHVVSGFAKGPDTHGLKWAEGIGLPRSIYPADWNTYGKAAGHIRNRQMADNSEALVAIWDGKSKGTQGMIFEAEKRGLHIFVYNYKDKTYQHIVPSKDNLASENSPS